MWGGEIPHQGLAVSRNWKSHQNQQRAASYMLGYDGSVYSKKALKETLQQYMHPKDKLTICSFFSGVEDSEGIGRAPTSTRTPQHQQLEQEKLNSIKQELEQLEKDLKTEYPDYEIEAVVDVHPSAKYALVKKAEDMNIHTIVVGSCGMSKFSRLLSHRQIGSVTEFIARHAHCNVLIVKDEASVKKESSMKEDEMH